MIATCQLVTKEYSMDLNTNDSAGKRSKFLSNAGLAILVLATAAFALKAIAHPERLARYTPLVIAHGALMLGWLAFFVRQARLILRNDMRHHMASGKMSWMLVLLMIGTSMIISYSLMVELQSAAVFIGNFFMLAAFSCFFIAAIRSIRRQDAESHKRYMLFASLTILLPAFGRIADVLFDREEPGLIMFLVIVILLPVVYDRATGRRIHKATIFGITATIVWVALMLATILSPVGPMLVEQLS